MCDSPPSFPALLEKKKETLKPAPFNFFPPAVLCPQANFSLVLEQRKRMSHFVLITLEPWLLCCGCAVGMKGEVISAGV